MKILHISASDITGGAARAAYRLHLGLLQKSVDSRMLVQQKASDDPSVFAPASTWQRSFIRMRWHLDQLSLRPYPNRSPGSFSPERIPSNRYLVDKIQEFEPDIVNLHWINGGMISIQDIPRIKQPIVWTLHDMWAFTGGCHYDEGCGAYQKQCGQCKVLASDKDADLSRRAWRQKEKQWRNANLTIVSPSHWLADCARQSSLFQNKQIKVIQNGLDTSSYHPVEKTLARKIFKLPQSKKLILFGALSATSNSRKGFNELSSALALLEKKDDIALGVFGASQPVNKPKFGIEIHYLGQLHDDYSLALLYSAADVFVLPSKQDNLPNTIIEALACGVPCVSFNIGGMPDMIDHQQNGYLARPYDTVDLANGITWVLEDEERQQKLSLNAREKA